MKAANPDGIELVTAAYNQSVAAGVTGAGLNHPLPWVLVAGKPLRDLTAAGLRHAVCAALPFGSKPASCR